MIINEMNESKTYIDSVEQVQKVLTKEHKVQAKKQLVGKIMREDLGMRYKKVKSVSIHANSPKNMVLRQQFALKYIELLRRGKTILCIDESWLGMTDFRRMKW